MKRCKLRVIDQVKQFTLNHPTSAVDKSIAITCRAAHFPALPAPVKKTCEYTAANFTRRIRGTSQPYQQCVTETFRTPHNLCTCSFFCHADNAAAPAIFALAPLSAMMTNAAAPAILALAPPSAMLTNAAAPAILAPALQSAMQIGRAHV